MTDIQEIHVKPETKSLSLNFIATSWELWRRGFYITWGGMSAFGILLLIAKFVKWLFQ